MSDLNSAIKTRYSLESEKQENLSCGNNITYAQLQDGDVVLDLGCGRGLETIQAAHLVGKCGQAVGLDLTPQMVNVAAENAAREKITNIKFVSGDIENLPFSDASFNVVISNCVINHAQDKSKVYREIFRVLKKEGRFVISDAVTKEPLPLEVKNDPNLWAECFGGAITEEEYLENIKSTGFSQVEIIKRREYVKNGYDFISLTIRAYK